MAATIAVVTAPVIVTATCGGGQHGEAVVALISTRGDVAVALTVDASRSAVADAATATVDIAATTITTVLISTSVRTTVGVAPVRIIATTEWGVITAAVAMVTTCLDATHAHQ